MNCKVDHADPSSAREMAHEVVQRVSAWRERDRQIRARLSDMRHEIEYFIEFAEQHAGGRKAQED